MTRSRSTSIRSRLIRLTSVVSLTAILVVTAGTAWLAYDFRRDALKEEIEAVAGILASNLAASLAFADGTAAQETLSSLQSMRIGVRAAVSGLDGSVLAAHGLAEPGFPETLDAVTPTDDEMAVTVPVIHAGRELGRLKVIASLEILQEAVWGILGLSAILLVGAAVLAWVLAAALARTITEPIEHLLAVMRQVAADLDFSHRAKRMGDDETLELIDGYNRMIETVEAYGADLAEAVDRAEYANQSKSRFLAGMSHELRTPLNAILGFSEVIKDEVFGPKSGMYRTYAGDIHRSARFLLELINDLLDMSRLDARNYEIEDGDVDLPELLLDCRKMLDQQAAAKSIALDLDQQDAPATIVADDRSLRQVALNLIGNAIKFTPEQGRVLVRTLIEENGDLAILVTDTGPGIPEEDLARVLEPFEQVRSHRSREQGGTGLGLAISRSIVELHGGTLRMESVVGEGTTARVTLPAHRVQGLDAAAPR
ncbi:MAG: ATP-binding protein [Thalassobaculaceae bacterium]